MEFKNHTYMAPAVAEVFETFTAPARKKLLALREIIFETAGAITAGGEFEETLRWGEPAYVTLRPSIGSTIRLGCAGNNDSDYAMYFQCTANLVPAFRTRFPDRFKFGGNRSVLFDLHDQIPVNELKHCIAMALTYHLNKNLPDHERWAQVASLLSAA